MGRSFLSRAGATAFWFPGCKAESLPFEASKFRGLNEDASYSGLLTSLTKEYNYQARVEGKLPVDLQGTLYSNGPGLFDRGGWRKRNALDGDGMVTAFRIHGGTANFRNRFVRTAKFLEEERAGKYLYESWTTQRPGGLLANLWDKHHPQGSAGVSARMWNDKLYAFGEKLPWELDPATLGTLGYSYLGLPAGTAVYSAHSKVDLRRNEWLHFGLEYGRKVKIHVTVFGNQGDLKFHRLLEPPSYVYIHDFFVSDRHILFNLHPVEISIFRMLTGRSSFKDSFRWKPEAGNQILVLDREGTSEPIQLTTEASWMWHAVNAYERGDEIVADFVGYDYPDTFLGEHPALSRVMTGQKARRIYPGQIRRYVIHPGKRTIHQEILDDGHHELPFVNLSLSCTKHRYGYFVAARKDEIFESSIVRADMETGRADRYQFEEGRYCSEAVFAPKPGFDYTHNLAQEPGWLLTLVYDSHSRTSYLAILQADRVSQGPIATIHLNHHVPMRFHGHWEASA